jgi:hypothetical protein
MKAKGRVEPSVGRVSVSGAFLIPGLVSLFFKNLFNRPGEVFKKKKSISWVSNSSYQPILKHGS